MSLHAVVNSWRTPCIAVPDSLGFHPKYVFLPGLFWQSPKRPPFPVKFEFNDPL